MHRVPWLAERLLRLHSEERPQQGWNTGAARGTRPVLRERWGVQSLGLRGACAVLILENKSFIDAAVHIVAHCSEV
jgi:hypothetical protein